MYKIKYLSILSILFLQGCAGAMLAAGVAGMATVEVTGKTVSDHAISAYNDQDCKLARKMQGRDVCQDRPDPDSATVAKDKPQVDVPPIVPPPPKVVVVSTSIDDTERVFAQRKAQK